MLRDLRRFALIAAAALLLSQADLKVGLYLGDLLKVGLNVREVVRTGFDVVGAQEPGQVTFRLLIVSTAEKAEELRARIARGASFAVIAQEESIDPSAQRGGLIGPIEPASLRSELRGALSGLAVGDVSPVIRVPIGFAVLQRVEAGGQPSLRGTEIAGIAAVGGIKYTISIDGFAEANTALDGVAKADNWNQDPLAICTYRKDAVSGVKATLTRLLGPQLPETRGTYSDLEIMQAHVALGQLHAYDGEMAATIEQFEVAYKLAAASAPAAADDMQQMLGVAHLHKAGIDNAIHHQPGDRCLLALRAGRPLTNTVDFDKAIEHFLALLSRRPDDLELRWLLNAAHLATGGYPDRVPERFRIPASAFESAEDVGRFVDVSAAAGVESFSSAGGVVVDDFDNDGVLEILTSNFDSCGRMQLFRRTGAGAFTDVAAKAGLQDQLGGLNLIQTDYNNDRCRDVLVLRGGWELAQRKSLLRNNCDGTFTDVTAASGLAVPATSTQTAVWVDIDNDGSLDLFVGNEDVESQLFRNRGDGTFEDIAAAAGVARRGFTKAVAAADYDNDGFVDLYVSNLGGGNYLYRNNGNRTFSEVADAAGVPGADRGFPAWFFDYDNDGWDDLFVSSYYLSIDEAARSYLGQPRNATTMKLYRNQRNGRFSDVTREAGLEKVFMPMGSNFGDIDNDGLLDIYLGTGSPSYGALVPSVLLRNRDGRAFVDVTASSGTGELHKGHGVAFADLDGDGDQEIVFKTGGATPGDAHAFRLFDNPGHGNDWLGVHLIGDRTNRAAIGARITVTVTNAAGQRRTVHRTVTSGGSFGASPLEQHVGLGRDARNVDVEIFWPVTKLRQRFANVQKNQVIAIREGDENMSRMTRRPLPFGAARAR